MGGLSTESQKKGRLRLGVLDLQVTVTPGSFSEHIWLTAPPRCQLLCSLPIWSFWISWLVFFATLFSSGVPGWVLWSHQISSPWIQVLLVSSGAVNRIVQFRNDHQTPVSILSLSWGKGRMTSLAKSQICPASLVWNWVLIQAFSCFNYLFICDGDLLLLGGSHLKKNKKTQRHQKVLTT